MYEREEKEKLNPKWHSKIKAGPSTVLVVVDMQKLFLTERKSPWSSPKLMSIIPNIEKIIKTIGKRNVIFTRFVPPKRWQDHIGSWRTYYRLNRSITRENISEESFKIVDELQPYISKQSLADRKKSSSIFTYGGFQTKIKLKPAKFVVFVGIETDYCVLAGAVDAMNRGY